jgi:hypothetical protein
MVVEGSSAELLFWRLISQRKRGRDGEPWTLTHPIWTWFVIALLTLE